MLQKGYKKRMSEREKRESLEIKTLYYTVSKAFDMSSATA